MSAADWLGCNHRSVENGPPSWSLPLDGDHRTDWVMSHEFTSGWGNFLWTSNISRWRISRLKSCKWAQTTYPLPRVTGQVRCGVQATPRQKEV